LTARSTENILDGDMNTASSILPVGFEGRVRTWEDQGTWFFIDLGAVFWLDELFLYALRPREGTVGSVASPPRGFTFLHSDGTRVISSQLPIPESFDFATLIDQPDADPMRYLRYLFQPRRVRYLFWHAHIPQGWGSRWTELMLFSPGHPAEVVMRSDFIDLGKTAGDGRPKVISNLSWDADIPPGTRLQVRSRSGNTQGEVYAFHDKIGEPVTEEKWLSLPKVLRGRIDTTVVVSEDWDSWSEAYNFSGEAFKSQSPRRFVQLEMILSTDDPQVAPAIDALSLKYQDALLQGARGQVAPRIALPNEDTRFTYTLLSAADAEDAGFDILRFALPTTAANVEVRAGDTNIEPSSIAIRADTLQISLPRAITADSVQVSFTTRVVHNATLFGLDLGSSSHPDLWQSVEPMTRRANIVMLPTLTGTTQLIDDLSISSPMLTPNGDGINDSVVIRFVAFKVAQRTPQVRIFDLAGRPVAELATPAIDGVAHVFTWNGRTTQGNLVPPGTYLCHIDLGADAGDDTALRTIAVAY
ncbi:MAG: gliding motility-associated C-terminal domain-containing protein, partial [Gemmatimonadota bacterium]|nr:gliding motility-associated C-terminal domain-containing protein [Gemmatimonadota bacterium]